MKTMKTRPYYITTAITYPNGSPHVGHAYEYIATDAIARFKRLDGFDVRFLTGTDEHGLKMVETAAAEGIPTAELARRNSDVFQRLQEQLNVSFDRFIRTTDADHHEASKEIWRRMWAGGVGTARGGSAWAGFHGDTGQGGGGIGRVTAFWVRSARLGRRLLFSLETVSMNALAERTGTCQAPVNSRHSCPHPSSAGKPYLPGCTSSWIRSRRPAGS